MQVKLVVSTAMAMGFATEYCLRWILLFYCATMECRKEQRATIKACVAWGFDASHTYNTLEAVWGTHTLSKTQVRHWFKVFTDDPAQSTSDAKRCGQPKTVRAPAGIKAVDHALESDRRSSSRELGAKLNVSHTSVLKVLKKDLKMRKIAPRFVPRRLTQDLVNERLQLSRRNLQRINDDQDILQRIVATDETWCYTYDP